MNKVRRLAEDLVNRYPALFGADFDKNKQALSQVSVIRTRSVRNQLAGAITKIMHERTPTAAEQTESDEGATIEDRVQLQRGATPSSSAAVNSDESSKQESDESSERPASKTESIENAAAIAG